MIHDAGIRFNNRLHVSFQLDDDTGDMSVTVNLIADDGPPIVATGEVLWGDE